MSQIKEETMEIAIVDFRSLPEFQNAREKQEALLAANPYMPISTPAEATMARARRTALRGGRTELQKGLKVIKGKVKDFTEMVTNETSDLIAITKDAEEKQQVEIDRYDELKRKEKEEKLRQERERMQGLKNQLKDFQKVKTSAIDTATVKTIDSIIEDIESAELQLDELQPDYLSIKRNLTEAAKKRKEQIEEDERLKEERRKAEEERKKLTEEKAKLEAERKKQEEALRKQREEQERKAKEEQEKEKARLEEEKKKLEEERKAQEAKLEAERKKIEAEKAELARVEKERKDQEEKEAREKEEATRKEELGRRKDLMLDMGWTYVPETFDFIYGTLVVEQWEVEQEPDSDHFDKELLPRFREAALAEGKRLEEIKPDREKLGEYLEKIRGIELPELKTATAQKFLSEITGRLETFTKEYLQQTKEL